jgi:hypothetical protein
MKGLEMKGRLVLIALAACACHRQPQENRAAAALAIPENVIPTKAPASKPPSVVPIPKDKAQLDRMILAGYTPHGNHLHPPGVIECPLAQGSEAVM